LTKFVKKVNYVWEQRKLGEIADKAVDNRGKTPFISKEGTHPLLEVASLGSGAPDYSKVTKYLSDETFKTELRAYIKEGDILFSTVGSIGLVSLMDTNENAAIAQNIVAFRANESYDSKFLYAMLSTEENQYKAQRIVMGAVQPSIKVSQLVDVEYFVTENIAEQRKLGEYFLNLDHLITLHQRKICIFIKKMPIDWEQRKLGDIAEVTKLAGFEFTEHVVYSDAGNIIALRGLNIKNGQLILDDVKYIDGSNFSKLNRSKLFIDDIMLTYVGTVGEVAIIKENNRFYLAPNVSRIRVQSNDSPKFISHYMRTDNFKNKVIFPLIATSSQPALSMENIRKFMINMPKNRDEQDCLAEYFDHLDHLITLHHRKCVVLRKKKVNDWEQRKVSDLLQERNEQASMSEEYPLMAFIANQGVAPKGERYDRSALVNDEAGKKYKRTKFGDFIYSSNNLACK